MSTGCSANDYQFEKLKKVPRSGNKEIQRNGREHSISNVQNESSILVKCKKVMEFGFVIGTGKYQWHRRYARDL